MSLIENGKVLGRQPALIIEAIAAALMFFVAFGLDGLSAEQATNIIAALTALSGFAVAKLTEQAALTAFTGAGKALLVLAVSYGANLSQEQVGLAVTAITMVATAFIWKNNSPKETAVTAA